MPKKSYFKGHGSEVLKSIRKAHPGYSKKEVDREFYSAANAKNAKPEQKMTKSKRKKKSAGTGTGSREIKTLISGSTRLDTFL